MTLFWRDLFLFTLTATFCEQVNGQLKGKYCNSAELNNRVVGAFCSCCDINSTCSFDQTKFELYCTCNKGFNDAGAGFTDDCMDIDECELEIDLCDEPEFGGICNNAVGSYSCSCADGYRFKNGSQYKCADINECELETDLCDKPEFGGICKNTNGSYSCDCEDGYRFKLGSQYKCENDTTKSKPESTPSGQTSTQEILTPNATAPYVTAYTQPATTHTQSATSATTHVQSTTSQSLTMTRSHHITTGQSVHRISTGKSRETTSSVSVSGLTRIGTVVRNESYWVVKVIWIGLSNRGDMNSNDSCDGRNLFKPERENCNEMLYICSQCSNGVGIHANSMLTAQSLSFSGHKEWSSVTNYTKQFIGPYKGFTQKVVLQNRANNTTKELDQIEITFSANQRRSTGDYVGNFTILRAKIDVKCQTNYYGNDCNVYCDASIRTEKCLCASDGTEWCYASVSTPLDVRCPNDLEIYLPSNAKQITMTLPQPLVDESRLACVSCPQSATLHEGVATIKFTFVDKLLGETTSCSYKIHVIKESTTVCHNETKKIFLRVNQTHSDEIGIGNTGVFIAFDRGVHKVKLQDHCYITYIVDVMGNITRKVQLQAKYPIRCTALTRFSLRVVNSYLLQHSHNLQKFCPGCQVSRSAPAVKCGNDTLIATWNSSLSADQQIWSRDLKTSLRKTLLQFETNNSNLDVTIMNPLPRVISPVRDGSGLNLRVFVNNVCVDQGFIYNPQYDVCERV